MKEGAINDVGRQDDEMQNDEMQDEESRHYDLAAVSQLISENRKLRVLFLVGVLITQCLNRGYEKISVNS